MKYKDLPSRKIVEKAIATSFETPAKNRKVYNWGMDTLVHLNFLESERVKLVQNYGKDDGNGNISVKPEHLNEFSKKFQEVLELEVDDYITCPIEENWFDDEKCEYPTNKKLWLSAAEISILVKK